MKTMSAVLVMATLVFLVPLHIYAQQSTVAADSQSEQRAQVQRFSFIGNTAFTPEVLSEIVKEFQGKELTLAELHSVAEKVADYYHQRGYFLAKVILPEQSIDNGNVTLQIFEGKLGKITISGNKSYPDGFLQKYFANMKQEGIIQQDSLESALLLVNDLPGLKAKSVLRAGAQNGDTDIIINVEENPRSQGSIEASSFGSRNWRSISFMNRGQRGGSFSTRVVDGNMPNNLSFVNASYSLPIDAKGTCASLYILKGDFGVGQEFASLNITGKASAIGAAFTRPLIKTRAQSIAAELGFDMRNSEQDMLGLTSSRDRIRVLRLGLHRNTEDMDGRTFMSLFLQQGLGSMFGGMDNNDPLSSRPVAGADGRFTKLNFDSARIQGLRPKSFLISRLSGQISSKSLVVGEQMAIGGIDSVRGYYSSEYLGDSGVQANLEARFASSATQPEKFQTALFVDWALASIRKPALGQTKSASLIGAGFGIRANIYENISIRADLGFALGRQPSDAGKAISYLQVSRKI